MPVTQFKEKRLRCLLSVSGLLFLLHGSHCPDSGGHGQALLAVDHVCSHPE